MKKTYQIWKRIIIQALSYYPEEKIEKCYFLGKKNEFLTKEEAINFLLKPENSRFFEEYSEYFIQEIFTKQEQNINSELNPINYA